MQKGNVYRNGVFTSVIARTAKDEYTFEYAQEYLSSQNPKAVSLTLPLQEEKFISKTLFPFFFNMLAEGSLKDIQCSELRIDKDDHFSRLLSTTKDNTIGSITIEEVQNEN